MAIETASRRRPAATRQRRKRGRVGEARGDDLVPTLSAARVSGEISLAHARVERGNDPRLVRLLRERQQRGHRDDRAPRGECQALPEAAGDANAREGPRALAEGEGIHAGGGEMRSLEG